MGSILGAEAGAGKQFALFLGGESGEPVSLASR